MKKALKAMVMLLFVFSMTALTSCNKEAENLIVGKWECTTATYTDEGSTYSVPELIGMIWEFKANGDLIGTLLDVEDDDYTAEASYVILGNILTITSTDLDGDVDTESYVIKELTKSKLVLEETDEGDETAVLEFKKIL
jgi:uncharacterized protein (TIGR03066 family)